MREPLAASDFPEEVTVVLGTVQRLSYPPQGDTSAIAIVESAGGAYAVKRSRGERFSEWLSQEYQVLRALAQTPLPTPQPYVFVQREVDGEPETWLVMEALPGEPLVTAVEKAANRTERRGLLRAFGHSLARIHRAAVPTELQGETRPWLDRMLERAEYALRHYPIDGDAALLEALKRQRPPPVPPVLIHGDFTIDNVLVLAGDVTGVIDWAGGEPGDPRYDLALAIRPQTTGLFQAPQDRQAFFEGYGLADLSAPEYDYFVRVYEFF
ncbi:MAG TPA: phosphotransferase [Ktedonobacterales bacterium]|jgi:aminoglycoside phosphotransferase (APT) family kinase protein